MHSMSGHVYNARGGTDNTHTCVAPTYLLRGRSTHVSAPTRCFFAPHPGNPFFWCRRHKDVAGRRPKTSRFESRTGPVRLLAKTPSSSDSSPSSESLLRRERALGANFLGVVGAKCTRLHSAPDDARAR